MGSRKSGIASIIGLGVGAYNTKQLSSLNRNYNTLIEGQKKNQRKNTELIHKSTELITNNQSLIMQGVDAVYTLQISSMIQLIEIDQKLNFLLEISWNIQEYFIRQEEKEQRLGDLKLIILFFERALNEIDETAKAHLEFATIQVEVLQELVERHDVRIEHFKTLSIDEQRQVIDILDRIEDNHFDFINRLKGD